MKKILILLLVLTLSLGLFTGCELLNQFFPSEQPPVDDGGDPEVDYLPDAVTFLHNIYKEKAETTLRDFDVVGQVLIDGVKFNVTWTCDNDKIAIKTSATNPVNYTVDLPSINEEEFSYTITATITAADGRSEQKSYTFKVPVLTGIETDLKEGVAYKISFAQVNLGKRLFALNKSQENKNKFILSTNNPKDAADFFVEIVDGGYKFYTEIDGVKTYVYAQLLLESGKDYPSKYVGFSTEQGSVFTYDKTIGAWYTVLDGSEFGMANEIKYGFGTYSTYDTLCISEWDQHFTSASDMGVKQFVAEFITSEYAETLAPEEAPEVEEPADGSTLTIEQAIKLGLEVTSTSKGKFYVTGKISEVYNDQYGNMYIVDDAGNKLQIYGTYDSTGENRYDAMTDKPKAGDTVTLYGTVGNFNGNAQMKNAWIISYVPGEDSGETPVDPKPETTPTVVTSPEAGVAYKFGIIVGGSVKYMTGEEKSGYSYYWLTSANYADGADVYVEVVAEGQYKLYCKVGETVKYMSVIQNGNYINASFTAETPSVYTWDATNNAFVTTLGEKTVALGTYSTYDTVSGNDVTRDGFVYATLYTLGAGSGDTPVDPQPPVHEHNFVEGKCECGETDPNYVPETPAECPFVAGTEYFFGYDNAGTMTYLDGTTVEGKAFRWNLTTDTAAAAKFILETADGGFYVTFNLNGTKYYLNIVENGSYVNLLAGDSAISVWTWNSDLKALVVTVNGTGFVPKAYNNYTTIEAKKLDYTYGATYVLTCVVIESGDTPVDPQPPVHEHNFVEGKCECGEIDPNYTPVDPDAHEHKDDNGDFKCDSCSELMLPAADSTLTLAQATAIGSLFEKSTYTTNKYWIEGVIQTIESNGTMTLKDSEGNTFYIYKSNGADGTYYDKLTTKHVVGDTVKVYGAIGMYDEPQMQYGKTTVVSHNHAFADATCIAPKTCACGVTEGEALTSHNYENGVCTMCKAEDPNYEGEVAVATYKKVTSKEDFTTGTYVLVVNGYVLTKYDNSWVLVTKLTETGDTIASNDIATWTLTVTDSGVTIKDANGTFIKPKSGNNNGIQTGEYNWAWTIDNSGNVNFKGVGGDTTILACNTGSENKIRAYKTSTVSGNPNGYPTNFSVYKLVTE